MKFCLFILSPFQFLSRNIFPQAGRKVKIFSRCPRFHRFYLTNESVPRASAGRSNDKKSIRPFYAEAETYPGFEGKQMSYGVKNLTEIPTYDIHTPKPELVKALQIIIKQNGRLRKKDMALFAEKENLITVNAREENYTQARFASLDKNIIQPLVEQWKFAEVKKIGRTRWVKITQEGINASEFLI